MTNRILWINPGVPPRGLNDEFQCTLEKEKRSETVVEVVSTDRGPRDLEYRYYEALIIPDVLHRIVQAESDGYDGVIIGCFYDPGLEAAKEIARITVTAPAEASMHLAARLGFQFSIIIGKDRWIPQIMENIHRYGMGERLASFRSIDMPVEDMGKDPKKTSSAIADASFRAINEDGADVIILGCTREYGLAERLQLELGVPVIDPVIAAFKSAEHLVEMAKRYGWGTSKLRGYRSPPLEQIHEWDLGGAYGVPNLWPRQDDREGMEVSR